MSRGSVGPAALDEPISMKNSHCRVHKSKHTRGNIKVRLIEQTQRSHEENQERAYIAASRRRDRSIEARVQSARMASEIHKKRTGRGFKISEEVVTKEEMYDEENADLPRHRLLGVNIQTPSTDLNANLEAYLTNKIEVSKMLAKANQEWRENEINRLFAQSFPNAVPAAQQAAILCQQPAESYFQESCGPKSGYPASQIAAKAAAPRNLTSTTQHHRTILSGRRSCASSSLTSGSHRNSLKSTSRPANTSGSETSTTQTTPSIDSTVSPQTPPDITQLSGFAFTTELPSEEFRVLGKADDDVITTQALANQKHQEHQIWLNPPTMHEPSEIPKTTQQNEIGSVHIPIPYGNDTDKTIASNHPTPGVLDNESWQTLINDSVWATD